MTAVGQAWISPPPH